MKRPANPESVDGIAERLVRLRIALGYEKNQAAFARFVGISPQAWNNYEAGARRIALDEAFKVCRQTGATLDWIYRDRTETLPMQLLERLPGTTGRPLRRA